MNWDVIVVGAGAAGLLAGARAAQRGRRTLLLEKNKKLGVKILMSGGTRCNITHHTNARGIVSAFGPNGSFLHSALAALSPERVVDLMHEIGVPTKVEETGKVFPVSDRALDVRDALVRYAQSSGCQISAGESVTSIRRAAESFLVTTPSRELSTNRLILTTGGKSYPGCGTTGDGYSWAQQLGHSLVSPRPALTPILTDDAWQHELSGLTLEDVELSLFQSQSTGDPSENRSGSLAPSFGGEGRVTERLGSGTGTKSEPDQQTIDQRRGGFLFTHFGISGPVALDMSGTITAFANPRVLMLRANFLPRQTTDSFRQRLQEATRADGKRRVVAVLNEHFPKSLARAFALQASIPEELPLAEFSRAKLDALVTRIFRCPIGIAGTKGFDKAEVTAGGVRLTDVDSRTMQSKLVPGLFLAGEILDLDGPIGGFNFQSAFSTGWLAGDEA